MHHPRCKTSGGGDKLEEVIPKKTTRREAQELHERIVLQLNLRKRLSNVTEVQVRTAADIYLHRMRSNASRNGFSEISIKEVISTVLPKIRSGTEQGVCTRYELDKAEKMFVLLGLVETNNESAKSA